MYRAQFRVRAQQALTAPRRSEFSMNSVEHMYAEEKARRNPHLSYREQERQRAIEDQNRWHYNLKRISIREDQALTRMEKRLKSLIDIAEVASEPINRFSIARGVTTIFMYFARKWRDR